jgi:predicted ATPase
MDMFFSTTKIPKKRRVHFHKFMLEVHQHIHSYKKHLLETYGRDTNLNLSSDRDPIQYAAQMIRKDSSLLCFDEFQVTDIADAIIMTKLFDSLWRNGTILVATSNRPPKDLYLGGLNRQYFLPFIDELSHRCVIRHLDSHLDYRYQHDYYPEEQTFFTPLGFNSTNKLRHLFESANSPDPSFSSLPLLTEIPVMMGRKLIVEARGNNCWVTFHQLCCHNLGASDYSALAKTMKVIYLDGIPCLSVLEHDVARRFITLIDEIYDAGRRLLWTSEKPPNELFQHLTPNRLTSNDISLGTDHSWSNNQIIHGETMSQDQDHGLREEKPKSDSKSLPEKLPTDGVFVSGKSLTPPPPLSPHE